MVKFEISDEGMLLSCEGECGNTITLPEGVKFIDRNFDFAAWSECKTLVLPKSFMGHELVEGWCSSFYFDPDDNYVIKYQMNHYANQNILRFWNAYAYLDLDIVDLPNLKRIEVDKDNPIYTSVDGVLFDKDRRYLIYLPRGFEGTLSLNHKFRSVCINKSKRRCLSNNDIKIEFLGKNLTSKVLSVIYEVFQGQICIYAPKTVSFAEIFIDSLEFHRMRLDRMTCIIPKLQDTYLNDELNKCVAKGYCYKPELYSTEQAKKCMYYLFTLEREVCAEISSSKDPVRKYYKSLWSSSEIQQLAESGYRGDLVTLSEAIMRGSLQDVQESLSTDKTLIDNYSRNQYPCVNFGAQALALACRYGGVDKVRALLDSESFTRGRGKDKTNTDLFIELGYFLWLSGYHEAFCKHPISNLYLNPKYEIRNLKPLSEKKRLECIKLLMDMGILDSACGVKESYLYLIAVATGDNALAKYLKSRGASIKSAIQDHQWEWQSDPLDIIKSVLLSQKDGVANLCKAMASEDIRYTLNKDYIDAILYSNNSLFIENFCSVLEYFDIKTEVVVDVLSNSIKTGETDVVAAFVKAGKIKSKVTTDKLIPISMDLKKHEITAVLVELKNKFGKKSVGGKKKSSLSL